jgi:hypothetical protein
MEYVIGAIALIVVFVFGYRIGKAKRQPVPTILPTTAPAVPYPEPITLEKPEEEEPVVKLVAKVVETIEAMNRPVLDYINVPFDKDIPIELGTTTVVLRRADPDLTEDEITVKLFWNNEELALDYDSVRDIECAFEDWEYRIEEYCGDEFRRKANELAKQILSA